MQGDSSHGNAANGFVRPGAFTAKRWLLCLAGAALIVAGVVLIGILEKWKFGEWIGVFGVLISLAGFSLAFVEIQHTRLVTAATGNAVKKALKAVASGRLAVVITQLSQLVVDLEDACARDNSEDARRTLNSWRALGTEAEGLMKRRFGPNHEHLAPLQRSILLATEAKPRLFGSESAQEATAECLDAMSKTADLIGPLLEEIAPTMEGLDADG